MNGTVFCCSELKIIKKDSEYFIRYDAGAVAIFQKESKITFDESLKAQKNEKDAYEVIIATQTREGKNKPMF
ncbi:hypothetical protein EHW65_20790 [Erwinia psidii]|uniref:hypothetical protein n=1 Tax=Erwinia psidii TaxID=69224 RepID=UPI00226B0282|nr:hypothetical protein [Erwinia psidii]MCX8959582.1 hypothetical protein [Erwinia psidii]